MQEAMDGVGARGAQPAAKPQPRTMKVEGPGVQFWDSRIVRGPRLVWTNADKVPNRRS